MIRHLFLATIHDMSSIRIHAIQTGTVAIKELQRDGNGTSLPRVLAARGWTEPLPIHAWLIEHPEGLILVDTGETARIAEPGYFTRWHPYFRLGVREWVEPQEEIGPRMNELGFDPDDVQTVVLTHFHTDHAGGLATFPRARILSSRVDYDRARGLAGKARGFLPQHWPAWYEPAFVDFGP